MQTQLCCYYIELSQRNIDYWYGISLRVEGVGIHSTTEAILTVYYKACQPYGLQKCESPAGQALPVLIPRLSVRRAHNRLGARSFSSRRQPACVYLGWWPGKTPPPVTPPVCNVTWLECVHILYVKNHVTAARRHTCVFCCVWAGYTTCLLSYEEVIQNPFYSVDLTDTYVLYVCAYTCTHSNGAALRST